MSFRGVSGEAMALNDLETCCINIDIIMIAKKDLSCHKIDKVSDDGGNFGITEPTQCVGLAAVQVLLQILFLFSLLTSLSTSFVSGLMTSYVLVCHWKLWDTHSYTGAKLGHKYFCLDKGGDF